MGFGNDCDCDYDCGCGDCGCGADVFDHFLGIVVVELQPREGQDGNDLFVVDDGQRTNVTEELERSQAVTGSEKGRVWEGGEFGGGATGTEGFSICSIWRVLHWSVGSLSEDFGQ